MMRHKTSPINQLGIAVFFCYCLTSSLLAQAADISVQVNSVAGKGVEDAVVYLVPLNKSALPLAGDASIAQLNKTFIPRVTVIQTGSRVSFPNKDKVRHHVYSFSPAKAFELKLYANVPAAPVVFDKPGTVVLGCNIHDNMLAFIHVVDTPYFAKTDASGQAKLSNFPGGQYQLKVWHAALKKENGVVEQTVTVKASAAMTVAIDVNAPI
jgi:plastocyanin